MYTDPIADLLTRIRNASSANVTTCYVPHSKLKENILKIMLEKGFIEKFEKTDDKLPEIAITLREGKRINLKRISKPGQRIYVKKDEMKPFKKGLGTKIVSTSKGLMTSEEAIKSSLGGEIICEIY
jgi:small subunit ribosomal protein S8